MNIFSSLSCAIKSPFSSSKKSTSGRSESNNNGSANGSAKPVYSPTENSKFDKLRESLQTKDTGSESSESTINTNNPPAINTGSSYLPPEPEPEPLAPIDPDEEVIEIMRKMIGQYDRMKARMAALEAEELAAQQAEEEAINKSSKKAKDELKKEEITEVKEETAVTEVEPSKGVVEEKSEEPKSAEATSTDMSSTEATSPAEDNKEGKKEPLAEAVTESTAESSVEAPPSDEEVKEVETKDSDSAEVKKEDVKDSETKVEETSAEVPSEKDSVVIEPTTVEVTTAVAVAVVAEGEKDKEIPSDDVKPAEPEQAQEVEEEQVEEEEEMGINLTRTEIETMFYFFTNLMNTGDEKTQMDVAASVASRLLGVPDLDPTADGGKNKLIDYLTSNFAKPPAPLADEDDADFNDIENSSPGRTRSLSAGGELRKSRTAQIGNEADIMSDRNYEVSI